jgi:hypothetical protein
VLCAPLACSRPLGTCGLPWEGVSGRQRLLAGRGLAASGMGGCGLAGRDHYMNAGCAWQLAGRGITGLGWDGSCKGGGRAVGGHSRRRRMRGQGSPTALVVEARTIVAMLGFVGEKQREKERHGKEKGHGGGVRTTLGEGNSHTSVFIND